MKIAIVGYGKMGKTIEQLARERNHEISWIIDADNQADLSKVSATNTDVAIEFSQPGAAYHNLKVLVSNKVTTVSGTTGWLEHYGEITSLCKAKGGTFLYASNFSVGVNLFFELNKWLAEKIQGQGFRPWMEEIHHTEKKDAPSGTAITLAEGILSKTPELDGWENPPSGDLTKIGIESVREGKVPGTHTISWESELETIDIRHTAHDRKVFAHGVIKVAEWITHQKGVLTFADFLKH